MRESAAGMPVGLRAVVVAKPPVRVAAALGVRVDRQVRER
jgi:hypothetical protein